MVTKNEAISKLLEFKGRLVGEVSSAYSQRGADFGDERFSAWCRQFGKFLDESFPGSRVKFDKKIVIGPFFASMHESDYSIFKRTKFDPALAFIDSLVMDIENDEHDFTYPIAATVKNAEQQKKEAGPRLDRVFVVHGHDEALKLKVARFVEKLGLEAIVLHEQASKGCTIIEKFEDYTDVGFAIVLYSPDDLGGVKHEVESGNYRARARQNVVFEHGYLIAKLSRSRVVPLVEGKIELPSDISGVVYVSSTDWQITIAKEMKAAGYAVDFNKLIAG